MRGLLCDSGPLIATFSPGEREHERCLRLLGDWPGKLLVPEPVLGETCNFLRNNVRNGPALESRFLNAVIRQGTAFEIVDPRPEDRQRAAELVERLVSGPLGYVDAIVVAVAERLDVPDVATVDFKLLGMASPVNRIPLHWVLQEQ